MINYYYYSYFIKQKHKHKIDGLGPSRVNSTLLGAGGHGGWVRAGVGLSEAETTYQLALGCQIVHMISEHMIYVVSDEVE
jgi:hypothetical protein